MEAEGQWQISEREICWSVAFIAAWSIIILLYLKLWHRPQRLKSMLQKQGINGPKPSFPFGNDSEMQQINQPPSLSLEALDEWAYSLYPYFHTWKQRYGPVFMYSTGTKQHLYVEIPELIKSIGSDSICHFQSLFWHLLCSRQFNFCKTDLHASDTSILFGFLNLRFLPTKENKELWKLQKEVEMMILKVIKDREADNQKSGTHENQKDLLQIILEGAASATTDTSRKGIFRPRYNINQLILDICKNVYFAGSESTALATIWTLLLLALHPEWQQRVRSEIMETYENMVPHSFHDKDKLRNLKALTMVIQESLRLYGPSTMATREVLANEVKLGEHVLPKGINMWLFTLALHRDPDNWGPDAREFKPERFAGGVSAACKYPQVYIPFGLGSRICLGQNFAMLQMKEVLCLLLSNFSFAVSPNYCHCPVDGLLLMPKYGVRLLASKVHETCCIVKVLFCVTPTCDQD
ncbi:Cytochrome P450 714A2 [Glycine max]|nr:Cytochrome P450 714A2 [Glycine max]